MPVYITAVFLMTGYFIAGMLISDMDNRTIAGLLDAVGFTAIDVSIMNAWSIAEKNTRMIPFEGVYMWNRIIWSSLGAFILLIAYRSFRFQQFLKSFGRPSSQVAEPDNGVPGISQNQKEAVPIQLVRSFSPSYRFRLFIAQSWLECRRLVFSSHFALLTFFAILLVSIGLIFGGKMYETEIYPVTSTVLQIVRRSFGLFIMIIITFFAGETVWRERDEESDQIIDSMPVPDWILFWSKVMSLLGTVLALLVIMALTGFAYQTLSGYFRYEPLLYIKELLGFQLINLTLFCLLAIFVQTIVSHKYIGHSVMVLYYLFKSFAWQFGLEHNMIIYASDSGHLYSDMNGYGNYVLPYFMFNFYWLAAGLLLSWVAYLFWPRGYGSRWKLARHRLHSKGTPAVALIFIAFITLGAIIYTNTNILHTFRTSVEKENLQANYEKQFKQYQNLPMPRITAVNINMEIYPDTLGYQVKGRYKLQNKTTVPIQAIHLTIPDEEIIIRSLELNRPFQKTFEDKELGYTILSLDQPLEPTATCQLNFDFHYEEEGFRNGSPNKTVAANGTFLHNTGFLPSIGYWPAVELRNDFDRKRHGLNPKDLLPGPEDLQARMNTYISNDSDWIDFEAVIGTTPDQTAFTSGKCTREWTENGRHYFKYENEAPMLNYFAVLSARYTLYRDKWNDVDIELYYHAPHNFNLKRISQAVKNSLEYYGNTIAPYPFHQVRIVEVPRYYSFAQSFPGTIPFSETMGFIAKIQDLQDEVDYPTLVIAHEMAHQWWAHQVIGGNVRGMTLLSEVMAQYESLSIMRNMYPKEAVQNYLRHELDQYLRGRSMESKGEMALMYDENKGYVHYNKGSMVMNALEAYAGRAPLNACLSRFLKQFRFQPPPYPSSLEFKEYLKDALPEDLQYLIHDMFQSIIIYDIKATRATVEKMPDDRYKVELTGEFKKYLCEELGEKKAQSMHDLVDVAVMDEDGKELYRNRHWLDDGTETLTFEVHGRPATAQFDPDLLLIDQNVRDNSIKVEL